jgi:hypothetical protein
MGERAVLALATGELNWLTAVQLTDRMGREQDHDAGLYLCKNFYAR